MRDPNITAVQLANELSSDSDIPVNESLPLIQWACRRQWNMDADLPDEEEIELLVGGGDDDQPRLGELKRKYDIIDRVLNLWF